MAAEGALITILLGSVMWRQWGRDRMAAEGRGTELFELRSHSVNGAATGWPRKV